MKVLLDWSSNAAHERKGHLKAIRLDAFSLKDFFNHMETLLICFSKEASPWKGNNRGKIVNILKFGVGRIFDFGYFMTMKD